MEKIKFTDSEIRKMGSMTNFNQHTDVRIFLAEKLNSKLAKKLKRIKSEQNRVGYLTPELSKERYELDDKLFKELKSKTDNETYERVSNQF